MGKRRKLTRKEFLCLVREQQPIYKELYIDRGLTARKVAENQNIHYEVWTPKVLFSVLGSKQLGHGGKRQNSGNKKGIHFCGGCRKQTKDCKDESPFCEKPEKLIADIEEILENVSEKDRKILAALLRIEKKEANKKKEAKKLGVKISTLNSYRRNFIRGDFPVIINL